MSKRWNSRHIACGVLIIGGVLVLMSVGAVMGAVHLENQDSFCASCHTEPEATYYDRTQSETPTDLASYHALYKIPVRCIDCHSGEGTQGRINALKQGATDLFAYIISDYHDPAQMDNPLGDEPCLKCHTLPSRDNPIEHEDDPQLIYSTSHYHWVEYTDAWLEVNPNPEGVCGVCHVSHSEGTIEALGFRYMPAVNAACDDCHTDLAGTIP